MSMRVQFTVDDDTEVTNFMALWAGLIGDNSNSQRNEKTTTICNIPAYIGLTDQLVLHVSNNYEN